jgi:hypothetical protein
MYFTGHFFTGKGGKLSAWTPKAVQGKNIAKITVIKT